MDTTIQFRYALADEAEYLTDLRIQFFKEAPELFSSEHLQETRKHIFEFLSKKLENGNCFALLAEYGTETVGTGMLYFYDTLASMQNPIGKIGYLTNIWVKKEFRRQGIATEIVRQLMEKAKKRCVVVTLSASEMGKSVYQNYGFEMVSQMMTYRFDDSKNLHE